MDGDVDLEEAHRIREEGILCVPPLVYLLDPGKVDPPAEAGLESQIFEFSQLIILATPHRITTA
jgi:hypothetical protein